MKVSLETTAETFNLEMNSPDSIDNVKVNVQDKKEITKKGSYHRLVLCTQGGMKISVKASAKTYVLDVESSETVGSVKAKLQDKEGAKKNLYFAGTQLDDQYTLAHYGIQNDFTLSYSSPPPISYPSRSWGYRW